MKMIFFAAFFSFTFTLLALTGCMGENAPIEQAQVIGTIVTEPAVTMEEAEPETVEIADPIIEVPTLIFYLPLGGVNIQMGANIEELIVAIGLPIAEFRMPSCAFDGTDIVYRFPGLQVHTIPIGEANFVHTIAITDDTVSTSGGIMLGSSFYDLLRAYGKNYVREYGMYTFTQGHTSISFFVDGGMVTHITYELDVHLYFEVN